MPNYKEDVTQLKAISFTTCGVNDLSDLAKAAERARFFDSIRIEKGAEYMRLTHPEVVKGRKFGQSLFIDPIENTARVAGGQTISIPKEIFYAKDVSDCIKKLEKKKLAQQREIELLEIKMHKENQRNEKNAKILALEAEINAFMLSKSEELAKLKEIK